MYADTTVIHSKLTSVDHELYYDKLIIWLRSEKGKVVISLEKEDIKACKESLLSLVETIEQIYQNEFLVEEGVE